MKNKLQYYVNEMKNFIYTFVGGKFNKKTNIILSKEQKSMLNISFLKRNADLYINEKRTEFVAFPIGTILSSDEELLYHKVDCFA